MDTKVRQKKKPIKYIESILNPIEQNPGKRRKKALPGFFIKAIQSKKFINLFGQCTFLRSTYLLVDKLTIFKE
ncbi:hypothetical protein TFUB20_01482 [Tannerella forsythia]|uniref:Uncharacterized protein n=1 Tax=Tannerella forsythia TaxID=28112 RepID=A0A1D3UNK5_TANFO|nr:hypothetical protein TFUB20_01482 [Tannerella forsythia]